MSENNSLLPLNKEDLRSTVVSFVSTERVLFFALLALLIASILGMLWYVNDSFFVEIPADGGTLTEGIVGTPRFINPLLATSDADVDLTALTFAGLLKPAPDGKLIEDLAESYTISEDGRIYTFTIKDNATFHDGRTVTADDVVFTVMRAQDPTLKSPRRANWDGVQVEKVSEKVVKFTLPQPYGPFLENTTMGILPSHLWKNVSSDQFPFSQYNVEPIGAGPYRIKDVVRNDAGLPEAYELVPFDRFSLGSPHIGSIIIRFYPSEEDLITAHVSNEVEGINSVSPASLARVSHSKHNILQAPLPRVFGVFFNQNVNPIFAEKTVREALNTAVDRSAVLRDVLSGYGRISHGPIPPGIAVGFDAQAAEVSSTASSTEDFTTRAKTILEKGGWTLDETGRWTKKVKGETQTLTFSLSTANTPELKAAAELLRKHWEAIGVPVDLKFFDTGDLNQTVIRPRRYDALLFGEIVGRELDLFPFWHSSQRNDPGLNIAQYANITADKLLESARSTSNLDEQKSALQSFEQEIAKDVPAVFLYSPDFIYVLPRKVRGATVGPLTTSGDRFANVHEWYVETERVWPFLKNLPRLSFLH